MTERDPLLERKCNSIAHNLLLMRLKSDIPATAFIREFEETVRCDAVHDFAPRRMEYRKKINASDPETMGRILAFKSTDSDELVAAQAVMHYALWHTKQLQAAVDWPTYIRYHTIDRAEQTLATIGIIGGAYGGLRLAAASFRHLQAARLAQSASAASSASTATPASAASSASAATPASTAAGAAHSSSAGAAPAAGAAVR